MGTADYRTIMYIGRKTRKYDSVNQNMNRVWTGAGTICEDIPVVQAANLTSHKDEFIDVTGMSPEELELRARQAVNDAEESVRKAHALGRLKSNGGAAGTLVEFATDEELRAELDRRNSQRNLAEQTVQVVKATPAEQTLQELSKKQRADESFLAERIPAAIDDVLGKASAELLDDDGLPLKSAIEESLGFSISEDDYARALDTTA